MKGLGIVIAIIVAVVVKVFIGNMIGSNPDRIIPQMIKSVESESAKLKAGGDFKDVKCYRDGKLNGVVFEYIFSDRNPVTKETFNGEVARTYIINDLKNNSDIKKVVDLDIHLRYIYKNGNNELLSDFIVNKNDLK